MKRFILCLSVVLLCVTTLTAQQFKVEKSEIFDKPDKGWNKVFQLKNGNTFFFHTARKDGMTVTVYDKQRKKIASNALESKLWNVDDIANADICGLYEIKGEPVLFINQSHKVYRLRLDPVNGTLVNEEEFSNEDGLGLASARYVEKDPASDCYAIFFVYYEKLFSLDERIKVLYFDGSHKQIGGARFELAGSGYRYQRFVGALVDGNKGVYMVLEGFNGESGAFNTRSDILLAKLDASRTGFITSTLKFNNDFKDLHASVIYNRKLNKIQLLTVAEIAFKVGRISGDITKTYATQLSFIDPEAMALTDVKSLYVNKVDDYAKSHIAKDFVFKGIPVGMFINADNSTTITMEELSTVNKDDYLGAIGILELDDTGAETTGYTIDKSQIIQGDFSFPFQNRRNKSIFKFPARNVMYTPRYMSYNYLNTPVGHYVIFNDVVADLEQNESESKPGSSQSASKFAAVCYKLGDKGIEKYYLGGKDKGPETVCFVDGSDYDQVTNTYATILIESEGRTTYSRIAWVSFN